MAQVPRIRTNACAGNTGYEGGLDPTLAQRSVTTGGEIIAKLAIVDPDGGVIASANLSAPSARPRLSGIQKTEDVRGYDAAIGRPSLEDDRLRNRDCGVRGDGISPYGVLTDIACSASAPCDQETGLICGSVLRGSFPRSGFVSTRCYAFPVLSPKGSVIMRGHNFWDTSDAQLEYRPLSDPSAQPTLVGLSEPGVVGNEGIDQLANCALPVGRGSPGSRECKATEDTANRNHNSASFPVPAGLAGGFFNVRLMNHNTDQPGGATVVTGKVRHWQSPGEAGRVLHVCYPATAPPGKLTDPDALTFSPFDTRTTCVPPTTSCQDNTTTFGACSAGTWSSLPGGRPRSLSECRHSPGSDPVCGETPEWIYSEPELVEGRPRPALVFVASSVRPTFKLTGRLYGVRCFEETGWDWTGSDEAGSAARSIILGTARGYRTAGTVYLKSSRKGL